MYRKSFIRRFVANTLQLNSNHRSINKKRNSLRKLFVESLENRRLLTTNIDLSPALPGLNVGSTAYISDHSVGLAGANENPTNASQSTGGETGTGISYDEIANQLTLNIFYSNLGSNFTGAHIHGPGSVLSPSTNANGPVLIDLVAVGAHTPGANQRTGNFTGTVTLTDAQEELLFDNKLYVNIHSTTISSGEIRAQLIPAGIDAETHVALSGGNVFINDIGAGTNNALTIVRNGANLEITDANGSLSGSGTGVVKMGTNKILIPMASITGTLAVQGGGGEDSLTVDFSGGSPVSAGLAFDGGQQATASGDSLTIVGGSFSSQSITFTTTGANGNNGMINVDNSQIFFAGLEPIKAGISANTIINLPAGAANVATLRNSANAGEIEIIDNGTTFENTVIPNPSSSLTVNLGAQGDQLSVTKLDAAFHASLVINGGAGLDKVSLSNVELVNSPGRGLEVGSAGVVEDLSINSSTISGNTALRGAGVLISGGTVVIDASTIANNIATGNTAIEGGGGIFNSGATMTIRNGSKLMGNIANGISGSGGGIFNLGGSLTVMGTTITGNTANRAGGGIETTAGSSVMLTGVTLNGNSAGVDIGKGATPNPGNGGGLHVTGNGNVNIMGGGTVSGNVAALEGGGLWNGSGTMTVNNVTIDQNMAKGNGTANGGGAIFNSGGTLSVSSSSINQNLANGANSTGDGILSKSGTLTITSTTIANQIDDGISVINGGTASIVGNTFDMNGIDVAITGNSGPDVIDVNPPSAPNTVSIGAKVVAFDSTVHSLRVQGSDGNDVFNVVPSSTMTMALDGGAPNLLLGDTLNLFAGTTSLTDNGTSISVPGNLPINYVNFERRRNPLIVDDSDVGFSSVGYTPFAKGYRDNGRYAAAGSVTQATWTFQNLQPGLYSVAATWTAHPNRATNAPFTVNGTEVRVNERLIPKDRLQFGSPFAELGEFVVNSDQFTVSLGTDANGFVIADAIRIELIEPRMIDNGDTGYLSTDFSPLGMGRHGTSQIANSDPLSEAVASWNFSGLTSGVYRVSASWVENANRASNASFLVNGANVLVDQRVAPNDRTIDGTNFEDLGLFTVIGADINVSLRSANSGVVNADAVFIELITPYQIDNGDAGYSANGMSPAKAGYRDDADFAAANAIAQSSWTFSNLTDGYYRVSATWSANGNRATNSPFAINGETVLVNQRLAPSDRIVGKTAFEDLGVFMVVNGQIQVSLGTAANGYVIADAILVEPVSIRVIDNGAPGYTSNGFVPFGAGYQHDLEYANKNTGATASWTFDNLPAGKYKVFATWTPHPNRATNAPFNVNGTLIAVNQRIAPAGIQEGKTSFQLLAEVTVVGNQLIVSLSTTGADNYVIADAVRIEPS